MVIYRTVILMIAVLMLGSEALKSGTNDEFRLDPAPLTCDFEQGGLCSWSIKSDSSAFRWTHFQAKTIFSTLGGGPPFDHTLSTQEGHYLAATFAKKDFNRATRFESAVFQASTKRCLTFFYYYFSYGNNLGFLNVLAHSPADKKDQVLWSRHSPDEGKQWVRGQVELPATGAAQQAVFQVIAGQGVGDFALDDITSKVGPCHNNVNICDFEQGPCNFNDFSDHNTDGVMAWHVVTPSQQTGFSGPSQDVTVGTYLGHYLAAHRSPTANHTTAVVYTTQYPASSDRRCFQFFYSSDTPAEKLVVTFRIGAGSSPLELTQTVTSPTRSWKKFNYALSASDVFMVKFVAELNLRTYIAIDDVSVTNGACR